MVYTPQDWFWVVGGDTSRAYSSAAKAYVPNYPADRVTRIDTEDNLRDVLWTQYPDGWPIPKTIAAWQARAALEMAGQLPAANAAVAQSGNVALKAAWEYAVTFDRQSNAVISLGAAIGLTPTDIDALFVAAAQLRV